MSKLPEPTTLHNPDQHPPASANGSPLPAPSPLATGSSSRPRTLPTQSGRKGGRPVLLAAGVVGALLAVDVAAHLTTGKSLVAGYALGPGTSERPDVILHTVKREPLDVTVTEKGQLESADNKDIVCRVRSGSRGVATTITWVIDDGARVRPGQLLMILDDSALKEEEDKQSIVVKEKLALKVKAETDYEIQLKTNETAVATAEAALTIAEINLDKLTGLSFDPSLKGQAALLGSFTVLVEGGSYQQLLDDLTGKISLAQSEVEQWRDRTNWAERMVKLNYMSPAQAQAEGARYDSAVETLRSLQAQKKLMISHDRRQQMTDLTNLRDNAQRTLETARLQARATEEQTRIAMQTATDVYVQEKAKLEDIQKQRAECKIYAPDDIEDGSMVVYFKNESGRYRGNNEGMIEQGAQVKEGQKMLRIPNLSKMQVNTKIHEAMVGRVKGDVRVPTKLVEFVQFGMLTNTDLVGRAVATRPDMVEQVREIFRREDPQFEYKKVADGQRAEIRVESVLDKKFVGHVRSVANIASQADFWSSDIKLFQTYVMIEGEVGPDGKVVPLEGERLKPDMTAEVTIHVEGTSGPVLTVPIQAVIGGAEMGGTREVFVKTATGYDRKPVTLGLYNDRMVEVRGGLDEGDEIVVNPKVLLAEEQIKTRDVDDTKNGNQKGGQKKGNYNKKGADGPGGGGGDPSKKKSDQGGFPGKKGGGGGGPPSIG